MQNVKGPQEQEVVYLMKTSSRNIYVTMSSTSFDARLSIEGQNVRKTMRKLCTVFIRVTGDLS